MTASLLLLVLACDDSDPKAGEPTTPGPPPTVPTTPEPPVESHAVVVRVAGEEAVTRVRGLGDTDGDGADEVLAATPAGTALVIGWGGLAARLYEVYAAPGGDADGDGLGDLALVPEGQWAWDPVGFALGPFDEDGLGVEQIDLWTEIPPDYWIGPSADAMADLDGDGLSDFTTLVWNPYAYHAGLLVGTTLVPHYEFVEIDGGLALLGPDEVAFGVGDGDVEVQDPSGALQQSLSGLPRSNRTTSTELRALGDIDGDGRADVASTASQGRAVGAGALLRSAPGAVALPAGFATQGADLAGEFDLDGDGATDVAVSWFDGAVYHVAIGLGPWSAIDQLDLEVVVEEPSALTGAVAGDADVDGDGVVDLALGTTDGLLVVSGADLLARPVGAVLPPAHVPVDGCVDGPPVGPRSIDASATPALAGTLAAADAPLRLLPDESAVTALTVGDVDGDRALDLVVGTSRWLGLDNETSGMLYAVRSLVLGATPLASAQRVPGLGAETFFGAHAVAGDLDGDGDDDVFTGDWWLPSAPDGIGCQAEGTPFDGFAPRAALVGDVDGDGAADLAVSVDDDPYDQRNRRVELWASAAPVLSGTPHATITEQGSDRELGSRVAAVGDWNGDGSADLAVHANHDWLADAWVAVVDGGVSGDASLDLAAHATFTYDGEVTALASVDADRDGYTDLLVGSQEFGDPDARYAGVVYLLSGGTAGTFDLASTAIADLRGTEDYQDLGAELAVGDTVGDSSIDLLVSQPSDGVWLFRDLGPGSRTTAEAEAHFEGGAEGTWLEPYVALGDLDGDGSDDVILATGELVPYAPTAGGVLVFFGGVR